MTLARLAASLFVVLVAIAVWTPAVAQANGCSGTIAGVPASKAATAGDAIVLDVDSVVTVTATGPVSARDGSVQPISRIRIAVDAGPLSWPLLDRAIQSPTATRAESINVGDIARGSVGLYHVTATAEGCEIGAWIKIVGRSPFTTVMGMTASALVALGGVLQGAGIKSSGRGKGGMKRALLGGLPTGLGACVLAQQHGAIPLTTEWLSAFSAVPMAIGGFTARASSSRAEIEAGPRIEASGPITPRSAPPEGRPPRLGRRARSSDTPSRARIETPTPATAAPTSASPGGAAAPSPSTSSAPATAVPTPDTATPAPAPAPATAASAPPGSAMPYGDAAPITETAGGAATIGGGTAIGAATVTSSEGADHDVPRSAYALLDSPPIAYAGKPIEVTIGIAPEQTPGVVGAEMHVPPTTVGAYVLCVDVVAEGFSLGPDQSWRNDLRVTSTDPYPTFKLDLTPQVPDGAVEPRSIQAMYAVDGQTIGLAVRPIAVLKDQTVVTNISTEQPPPVDISVGSEEEAPDVTIRILVGQRNQPGLLTVSVDTPYGDVDRPGSFTVDIGEDSAVYARNLVKQISRREGQPGLYEYVLGTGKEIAAQLPQPFWDLLSAVAAKTEGPPTVLILSQEPYIPWELAVFDRPLDPAAPPFLAAQMIVGRWILADRGPSLPPPTQVDVNKWAVICGSYYDAEGQRLIEAEEEARLLQEVYQAAAVNADMREVLECLKGIPPAELLHFAVHGRYDPGDLDEGLVLVDGTVLAAEQIRSRALRTAPFVFLNACQVGSGEKVLGDYSGMAAAFLYAGASGVVAPLWSVRDVIAKDVAIRFYDRALKGALAAEVLRQERAAFVDSPDTTSATYLAYQFYGHPSLRVTRTTG